MFDIKKTTQPRSLEEAVRALVADPSSKCIAGGTDMLPRLHRRELGSCSLVSLGNIQELKNISETEESDLLIGPLCTCQQLTREPLLRRRLPLLYQVFSQIASPPIRRMATIGGNICRPLPGGDLAVLLLALDARLYIQGPASARWLPIFQLYHEGGKLEPQPWEILGRILIPRTSLENNQLKYAKHNSSGPSIRLALRLERGEEGCIKTLRLAIALPGQWPCTQPRTEAALRGLSPAEALEKLPQLLPKDLSPLHHPQIDRSSQLQVAVELSRRCLTKLIQEGGPRA